jgi:hypothetical protein
MVITTGATLLSLSVMMIVLVVEIGMQEGVLTAAMIVMELTVAVIVIMQIMAAMMPCIYIYLYAYIYMYIYICIYMYNIYIYTIICSKNDTISSTTIIYQSHLFPLFLLLIHLYIYSYIQLFIYSFIQVIILLLP